MINRFRRRGANAVEFALIIPILSVIMGGLVDYGWYFYREGQVTNALRDAIRAGGVQHQTNAETVANNGQCSSCVNTTATMAAASLNSLGYNGITATDVTPTISRVSGICALTLAPPNIPHTPLMGLVPMPTRYNVQLTYTAIYVLGC